MAEQGPVSDFLGAFSTDSKFLLSQPFLWKVSIGAENALAEAVNTACHKAGEDWRAMSLPDEYTKNGSILVAQEVSIPGEQTSFGEYGQENRGGFLPGYGVTQRESFLTRQLSINFFETKVDIEHTFFRPWMIAIAIDGLVNPELKCSIVVTQYDNQMQKRKGFIFDDAFPTICEPYTLSYGDGEFTVKSVTFGCRNYRPIKLVDDIAMNTRGGFPGIAGLA
tara:strand:+ start:548 stop:1213 length:666 start_codon:yes stop_codon:yes gene_type:complete